ncbi:MAG: helix-turn-helix transcriptional regulator [Parvularculaceae bacterium]
MFTLSASTVAAKIAACASREELMALFKAFTDNCGARCAVLYSFEFGLEGAKESWTPYYSSYPEAVSRYYSDFCCIEDDPFARAAFESVLPVRFQAVKDSLQVSERTQGLHDLLMAHGLCDAIAMHVCDRPGRLVYLALAFDRMLDDVTPVDLRRLLAMVEMFARHAATLEDGGNGPRDLSPGERTVLTHLARGASNKEIARSLGLSPSTVNTVVNRCFEKLGASNRTQAALAATRIGLALVA